MKKFLLTALLALITTGINAQTGETGKQKGMNTLAEEFLKKSEGTLIMEKPESITVTRSADGYTLHTKGHYNGYDYELEFTYSTEPLQFITVESHGISTNDENRIVFIDADKLELSKSKEKHTAHITKEGNDSYSYRIQLQGKPGSAMATLSETDSEWNFNIPFTNKPAEGKNKRYQPYARFNFDLLCDPEFGMGLVSAHSQAPGMNVGFGNAGWEFIINNLFKWEYRPLKTTSLSLGFGVDWRNYRMKGERRFMKEGGKLVIAPYPDNANIDFSRIKVFSMTLELLIKQKLSKNITIAAGPVVNFNTHASIKTRYETGSGKEKEGFKETSSSIRQEPVTIDFKGVLKIDPVSFYFKYSPVNTLDTEFGPEFKSMSAGMLIGF